MPRVGDKYRTPFDGIHILALVDGRHEVYVALIGWETANRWCEPIRVMDTANITEDEWRVISGGGEFTPLEKTKCSCQQKRDRENAERV